MSDLTKEQIDAYLEEIKTMSRFSMCRLHRFAPPGHLFFNSDYPELYGAFMKRFDELGGFSPDISKELGWE